MSLLSGCRACRSENLLTFLPMGDHPLAQAFVPPERRDETQPKFPLDSEVCLDCGLIQVADNVPANYFHHYLYVPSGADTMHRHFAGLADHLVKIAAGGLIVDIGCNDALLLSACKARGARTLGIDPAANLAEHARARGVSVHTDYFGPATADRVREAHGRAAVIVTTNTFNHIGDLHDFMEGVQRLLGDDGTFVIEVPWARDLLDKNEFDTIYHEHVSEFSLLSVEKLADFFGLEVVDAIKLPVHGGSMRVSLRRRGTARPTAVVGEMLRQEAAEGMLRAETYTAFADRIDDIGRRLKAMLGEMKTQGLTLAGYGATAKGNTLLNYFQIGPDLLDFVVDRNPLKHGLFSPGMMIPVVGPEAIEGRRPDVLLVLAWNFFDEIREQQSAFLERGGRFLVPLPEPRLVAREPERDVTIENA